MFRVYQVEDPWAIEQAGAAIGRHSAVESQRSTTETVELVDRGLPERVTDRNNCEPRSNPSKHRPNAHGSSRWTLRIDRGDRIEQPATECWVQGAAPISPVVQTRVHMEWMVPVRAVARSRHEDGWEVEERGLTAAAVVALWPFSQQLLRSEEVVEAPRLGVQKKAMAVGSPSWAVPRWRFRGRDRDHIDVGTDRSSPSRPVHSGSIVAHPPARQLPGICKLRIG